MLTHLRVRLGEGAVYGWGIVCALVAASSVCSDFELGEVDDYWPRGPAGEFQTNSYLSDYNQLDIGMQVAKWMRAHPQASKVRWANEQCWIYNHPKSGTV